MAKKNPEANSSKEGTRGQRKAAAYAARQRRKRRQTYYTLGMVVVVIAAIVVVFVWSNRPLNVEVPDVSRYADLPVSMDDDGTFILGAPDAPVLLEEFSSFRCTHCADFSETIDELIDPYIHDGSLAVKFMPIVGNNQLALLAGAGALCAGQQDPIKFWEMHDVLFSWSNETSYTQQHIEEAAKKLDLDTDELTSCMNSEGVITVLQNASDEAAARDVTGTPQLFFNGEYPNCGADDPSQCVGALSYDIVVQNIEQRLAAAEEGADTADNAGGDEDAPAGDESGDAEQDTGTTENTDETGAEETNDSGGE